MLWKNYLPWLYLYEHRAMKHFILSARAGDNDSLDEVKDGYVNGIVTKDEYANTLGAYQQRQNQMKSDDREKALANIYNGVMIV